MDFHRLTRRELQSLCKKNKIPANVTNVAMADSLKALEIVEGLQEILQPCESESARSSVESPIKMDVTSPYVPPTGGRSTRRRNIVKEVDESEKPMTRTRRTTRKAPAEDADAIETPAVVGRTNRKKGDPASACRKMYSELNECVKEEKKDTLMTPAPSGVTSQSRRVKEVTAVKRVYSTRRSVRLAEKHMKMLNEEEDKKSGSSNMDLFTEDDENVEMHLKEGSDDHEISGITGVDASTNEEENSETKEEPEVISTSNERELANITNEERNDHFETDGSKPEVEEGGDEKIEEIKFDFETRADVKMEKTEGPEGISTGNERELVSINEDKRGNGFGTCGSEPEVKEGGDEKIEEIEFDFYTKPEVEMVNKQGSEGISTGNEREPASITKEERGDHFKTDGSKPVVECGDDKIDEIEFDFVTEPEVEMVKLEGSDDGILTGNERGLANINKYERDNHFKTDGSEMELEGGDEEIEFDAVTKAEVEMEKKEGSEVISFGNEKELARITEEERENRFETEVEGSNKKIEEIEFSFEIEAKLGLEKKDEPEVLEIGDEREQLTSTIEEERDDDLETDASSLEVEVGDAEIEEVEFVIETQAKLDKENLDIGEEDPRDENIVMPLNTSNYIRESDGSRSICTSEVEIAVANTKEVNTAGVLKSQGDNEFSYDTDTYNEIEKEFYSDKGNDKEDVPDFNNNEEVQKINAEEVDVDVYEMEADADISSYSVTLENLEEFVNEIYQSTAESIKDVDRLPHDASGGLGADTLGHLLISAMDEKSHEIPPSCAGLDSSVIDKPTSVTPIKKSASKGSAAKKRTTSAVVSDNKENISTVGNLVLAEERFRKVNENAVNVLNMSDLSVRKLTKMLKEKLEITKKSKNENDNKVAPARPALQAIPENQ